MDNLKSPLETQRLAYSVKIPKRLSKLNSLSLHPVKELSSDSEILSLFPKLSSHSLYKAVEGQPNTTPPLRIGVFFSGGPAPGGHNVIAGLLDALLSFAPDQPEKKNALFGFLKGPEGLLSGNVKEISTDIINQYRNLGGFDLLGTSRTKIESRAQMEMALATCRKLALDGLIVIGGDDSNTNAAILASFFLENQCNTCVIGIPKTIDGDLKNEFVSVSFGFDTACRVYAEMIGNICKDAKSAGTYTHFIKLMGRSASHVTLECALATQPNYALIGEEIKEKKQTLSSLVSELADLIAERHKKGKSYGVILVPEGVVEFIPEISSLIEDLNTLLSKGEPSSSFEIIAKLPKSSRECFESLPEPTQRQLLLRRDPHGNVQVSLIETEKLLAELTGRELEKRRREGSFQGSFTHRTHFLGYEGRSALPSNFDATYCYALGLTSALLVKSRLSGYMAFVSELHKPVSEWEIGAVPLVSLMHMSLRKGKAKPVIKKSLLDCTAKPFTSFATQRANWGIEDLYRFPGPMQFEEEEKNWIPHSLRLETLG